MLNNTRRGVQIKANKPPEAASENTLLVDSLHNEIGVLSRKLGSKTEALAIMGRELDQTRQDRDQFRALLEQLRGAHGNKASWNSVTSDAGLRHQLATSRHQCAQLEQMVSDLSQKMEEVCGDMMVLRRDAVRERSAVTAPAVDQGEEKQIMVDKMERLQNQCDQLRRDLEQVLDEKEELVTQRDAFKAKAHRLNHQLCVALSAPAGSAPDVDALVTENRYLQEQLSTSQQEMERLSRACTKYKSLVEVRKKKGILRLGGSESSALVVTKGQVEEMLRSGTGSGPLADTPATLTDLRSLCGALLEQLQDKCTALSHQRRANRLLAEHCADLRQMALKHGLSVQPAAALMQGYTATNLDRESEQLLTAPELEPAGAAAVQPCSPTSEGSPRRRGRPSASASDTDSSGCSTASPGSSTPAGGTASPRRATAGSGGPSPRRAAAGSTGPSPRRRPPRRQTPPSDEEILSLQQLDQYVRSVRTPRSGADLSDPVSPADGSPQRTSPGQPDVQVVSSPQRTVRPTAGGQVTAVRPPGQDDDGWQLPDPLQSLYRRALEELRAGEQAM